MDKIKRHPSASACGSPAGTAIPVSAIRAAVSPTSVATHGTPLAMASPVTLGNAWRGRQGVNVQGIHHPGNIVTISEQVEIGFKTGFINPGG